MATRGVYRGQGGAGRRGAGEKGPLTRTRGLGFFLLEAGYVLSGLFLINEAEDMSFQHVPHLFSAASCSVSHLSAWPCSSCVGLLLSLLRTPASWELGSQVSAWNEGPSGHHAATSLLEGHRLWPCILSIPAPHLQVTFPQAFSELRDLASMPRPLPTSCHPPTRLMNERCVLSTAPCLGPAPHGQDGRGPGFAGRRQSPAGGELSSGKPQG